jgi:hypothetical protein
VSTPTRTLRLLFLFFTICGFVSTACRRIPSGAAPRGWPIAFGHYSKADLMKQPTIDTARIIDKKLGTGYTTGARPNLIDKRSQK